MVFVTIRFSKLYEEDAASFDCRTNRRFIGVVYIYDDTNVITVIRTLATCIPRRGRMNPEQGHKNKKGLRRMQSSGEKEEKAD